MASDFQPDWNISPGLYRYAATVQRDGQNILESFFRGLIPSWAKVSVIHTTLTLKIMPSFERYSLMSVFYTLDKYSMFYLPGINCTVALRAPVRQVAHTHSPLDMNINSRTY